MKESNSEMSPVLHIHFLSQKKYAGKSNQTTIHIFKKSAMIK